MRKRQLAALIEARERAVADEARAAVVSLNAQARRVQLARDRLAIYSAQRADAAKKREANQPGRSCSNRRSRSNGSKPVEKSSLR